MEMSKKMPGYEVMYMNHGKNGFSEYRILYWASAHEFYLLPLIFLCNVEGG